LLTKTKPLRENRGFVLPDAFGNALGNSIVAGLSAKSGPVAENGKLSAKEHKKKATHFPSRPYQPIPELCCDDRHCLNWHPQGRVKQVTFVPNVQACRLKLKFA
jgi:hypothetical protein